MLSEKHNTSEWNFFMFSNMHVVNLDGLILIKSLLKHLLDTFAVSAKIPKV